MVLNLVPRIGVWLCGSIGLLFLFVTFTPFVSWYGGTLAGQWTDPDGDTLIVLAGGDLDNGFPSNSRCGVVCMPFVPTRPATSERL
jgi:hypothetical protein